MPCTSLRKLTLWSLLLMGPLLHWLDHFHLLVAIALIVFCLQDHTGKAMFHLLLRFLEVLQDLNLYCLVFPSKAPELTWVQEFWSIDQEVCFTLIFHHRSAWWARGEVYNVAIGAVINLQSPSIQEWTIFFQIGTEGLPLWTSAIAPPFLKWIIHL